MNPCQSIRFLSAKPMTWRFRGEIWPRRCVRRTRSPENIKSIRLALRIEVIDMASASPSGLAGSKVFVVSLRRRSSHCGGRLWKQPVDSSNWLERVQPGRIRIHHCLPRFLLAGKKEVKTLLNEYEKIKGAVAKLAS